MKHVGESIAWHEHVTCTYNLRCGLTQCDIRWQPNQQPALHAEREGVYKKEWASVESKCPRDYCTWGRLDAECVLKCVFQHQHILQNAQERPTLVIALSQAIQRISLLQVMWVGEFEGVSGCVVFVIICV